MEDSRYEPWLNRVEQIASTDGVQAALQFVRGTASFDPDPRVRQREGILLFRQNRYREAAEVLSSLTDALSRDPLTDHYLGQALSFLGRHDEALARMRRAAAAGPRSSSTDVVLANALTGAGRSQEAVELLEHTARAFPDDPDVVTALARALLAADRGEEAIRRAEDAVKRWPDSAGVHGALGETLLGLGRHAESLRPLRAAVARAPAEPSWRRWLATAEFLLGDARAAAEILEEGLREVEDPELHELLARIHLKMGRPNEAVEHASMAVSLAPDSSVNRVTLARALGGSGRQAEALDALREALRRQPVSEEARSLAAQLGVSA